MDMFVENGHKRTFLESLVKDYHNVKNKIKDHQIRKEFKKGNKDITFTSGEILQSILCQTETTT